MSSSPPNIGIGAVVQATGVRESTLRAWETRYGFPTPEREAGGHRRYSTEQVEQIRRVVRHREQGLAMPVAIERVKAAGRKRSASIFASLREQRPEIAPQSIKRSHMARLARVVEEETAARAEEGVLIGAFQRASFYRRAEDRWRDLARGGMRSFVLADFDRLRAPAGAPAEVPIELSEPIAAEWTLICLAEGHSVCLIGRERPGQDQDDRERTFDGFLSLEPSVVREAGEAAVEIAAPRAPGVVAEVRSRMDEVGDADPAAQLRLSGAITSRLIAALG